MCSSDLHNDIVFSMSFNRDGSLLGKLCNNMASILEFRALLDFNLPVFSYHMQGQEIENNRPEIGKSSEGEPF